MSECADMKDAPIAELPGHVFLAKMGKKLIRPGGRQATELLFGLAGLQRGERVCEIATNRAITAIEMAERFGVDVDGVDASSDFLSIAEQNIAAHRLQERIRVHLGKGGELPFEDDTFDAVVVEAVITMLPVHQKAETLREAHRVLKPGGRLVLHELSYLEGAPDKLRQELVHAIRHAAWPLLESEWREIVAEVGFAVATAKRGPMSLMTPRGLVRDEGLGGVARIFRNVLRTTGAWSRFRSMGGFFIRNRRHLNYIVLRADKPS